jgi:hypothetical protein
VLVHCEGTGKPLPEFTPVVAFWDSWLSHYRWLVRLNSMVLLPLSLPLLVSSCSPLLQFTLTKASKIFRHGLLNSIVKRWKMYWMNIRQAKEKYVIF